MVGVRNGYTKITSVSAAENSTDLTQITQTYHSGIVAFRGKGDKVEATSHNIQHLQDLVEPEGVKEGRGIKMGINLLITPAKYLPSMTETKLYSTVKKGIQAAKEQGERGVNIISNIALTPFNAFRKIIDMETSLMQEALDNLAEKINDKGDDTLAHTQKFLRGGENIAYSEVSESISAAVRTGNLPMEIGLALLRAVDAKQIMNGGSRDAETNNVELASLMAIITSDMAPGGVLSERFATDHFVIPSSCESGKDRDGLKQTETSIRAVRDFFRAERGIEAVWRV